MISSTEVRRYTCVAAAGRLLQGNLWTFDGRDCVYRIPYGSKWFAGQREVVTILVEKFDIESFSDFQANEQTL